MTYVPTPEQFMASTDHEDELPEGSVFNDDEMLARRQPQVAIALALRQLVELTRDGGGPASSAVHPDTERAQLLTEQLADADAQHGALLGLVEEISEIVKPSTSKLANAVRAAIDRYSGVERPEPEQRETAGPEAVEVEADRVDAESLESLREHAASRGVMGTDQMNRSQLRTALGIPHPSSEPTA